MLPRVLIGQSGLRWGFNDAHVVQPKSLSVKPERDMPIHAGLRLSSRDSRPRHLAVPVSRGAGTGPRLSHSPTILTKTRFRRRPSRLACQPFRLAPKICSQGPKTSTSPRPITVYCSPLQCLAFQVGVTVVPSTPPLDTLGGASGQASPVRFWR
jgi:hypothetical protein